MNKVAIVTGGSSGIGRQTAAALQEAGCTVYELSRRDVPQEGIAHITCDVTDEAQLISAAARVFEAEGRIDILVNNAGFGISGAVETTPLSEARRQLEVNLFGMAAATRAVLPYMRAQGGGRVISVSSVAGVLPIPFQAWYSVSKAAINSLTMAMAGEVRPFGISMCAVMPGDIRTGFTDARCKGDDRSGAYSAVLAKSVARMEKDERGGMDPSAAGRFIARMALKKRVPPLVTIGFTYKLCALLQRLLPSGLVCRILYGMYAS